MVRGCGLGEEVALGVWPGRGSGCRGVAWERKWLQRCGLEVAAGGVAWKRKWLQEVWPGRGSGCRGCGLGEEVTAGPRECGLGEEVAAGGVAWERK